MSADYRARTTNKFVCKYCHKGFVQEHRYLQHQCKQMKRLQELKTPLGQAGYSYYCTWLRTQNKLAPPATTFLDSKYFRTFINFADFVQRVRLPTPEKFIWLMCRHKMQPTLWCLDEMYSMYMDFIDTKTSPMEHVNISLQTLLDVSTRMDIPVEQFFDKLPIYEIIDLLGTRQLSPWLLLCSPSFKRMFRDRTTVEQRGIIETYIRPDIWSDKFEKHSDAVAQIKQYVAEIGI